MTSVVVDEVAAARAVLARALAAAEGHEVIAGDAAALARVRAIGSAVSAYELAETAAAGSA